MPYLLYAVRASWVIGVREVCCTVATTLQIMLRFVMMCLFVYVCFAVIPVVV